MHISVRREVVLSAVMDKDVIRANLVGECRAFFQMGVLQCHGHECLLFREGEQEGILVSFLYAGSFFFAQPFLKEAGEGCAVDDLARGFVCHCDFAIACQRKFGQLGASACPMRKVGELIQADGLMVGIAGKQIVGTEGAVLEIIIEILSQQRAM